MAKKVTKVSKHSRAARRLEVEEPVKTLSNVSRSEKTDVTSAIIRATVKKNEDLLHSKQVKKEQTRISKKKSGSSLGSNVNREKLERAILLSEKLEGKIMKSKERARMVQLTRKLNWDAINANAKPVVGGSASTSKKDSDKDAEDEMEEDKFYTDDEEETSTVIKSSSNAFALLGDDVDA